jgi:glycosyltransferase involved in cell wall biosynthesis
MNLTSTHKKVSVVMCSRNGASFLNKQLESLEAQTYPHLEFICSDNESEDGTADILIAWCSQQPNRKFVTCSEKGLNRNFFHALEFATGELVIFCDQDDVWFPEKIEKLVSFMMEHEDASMVYGLSKPFRGEIPEDAQIKKIERLEGTDIRKTMLTSFTLGHNMLVKKSVLDRMPVPATETVAYDWWITVCAMCIGPIYCLPEVITYWRQHQNNTTTKLNAGLYFESRLTYLKTFHNIPLISNGNKKWIHDAVLAFETLKEKRFSFALFRFIYNNRSLLFFFKKKNKNAISFRISSIKWALRMSKRNYTLNQ